MDRRNRSALLARQGPTTFISPRVTRSGSRKGWFNVGSQATVFCDLAMRSLWNVGPPLRQTCARGLMLSVQPVTQAHRDGG